MRNFTRRIIIYFFDTSSAELLDGSEHWIEDLVEGNYLDHFRRSLSLVAFRFWGIANVPTKFQDISLSYRDWIFTIKPLCSKYLSGALKLSQKYVTVHKKIKIREYIDIAFFKAGCSISSIPLSNIQRLCKNLLWG
jgi:hypothetical protein